MSESIGKREREKQQQERAARKRERRQNRSQASGSDEPDADALMARFQTASEQLAAGAIASEAYEAERRTIFTALGLDDGTGP